MNNEKLITDWKRYLRANGSYSGDLSPVIDKSFVKAIKKAEIDLALMLNNKAMIGLIWRGGAINPEVPASEYDAGLRLMNNYFAKIRKEAQATLDEIGPPGEVPSAVKFTPTTDDMAGETGDPDLSQQIGRLVNKVPKKII